MFDLNRSLKFYLSMYASQTGVKEGELRRARGIDDFLIDADTNRWDDPKVFISQFLTLCCHGNTRYDQVLCLVAMDLMDDAVRSRPTEEERRRRLKDCLEIALNPGTYEEIRKWIDLWF